MRPELFEAMRSSSLALYARAWHALKLSACLPPSLSDERPFHGIPRLCLWEDKSGWYVEGARPYTLTVFELFAEDYSRYPVVREAAWRRDDDMAALQAEVERSEKAAVIDPTFAVRDGDVPSAEFAASLREATSFRVPLVWLSISASCTTDVGSAGFEFFSRDQPAAVLRLEWSFVMPESWRPIVGWVEKMRNFLIGCLPPASGPAHSGNSLVDR
jgi:hypothetical protein